MQNDEKSVSSEARRTLFGTGGESPPQESEAGARLAAGPWFPPMHTPAPPTRTRKRSLRWLRTPRPTQTLPRGEASGGRVGPTCAAAHAQPGPRPSNNRLTKRRRPARRQKRRALPAAGEAAAPPGALGLYAEAAKTHEPRESRLPAGSRRASTRCPRFQEALGSVTSILCSGPGLRHLFSINRATAANPGLRTAQRPPRFRPPARPLISAHAAGRAHATRRPVPDCFSRALTAGSRGPPRRRTNRGSRAEGWARFSELLQNTRPPPSPVNTLQSLCLRGNDFSLPWLQRASLQDRIAHYSEQSQLLKVREEKHLCVYFQ